MTETLNISNGTTTISFLDNSAIKLIEWLPAVATPEIISRESALSDFQAPIRRNYKNIVETFRLYIVGTSQDVVAGSLNSLLALLEDMVLYHTTENLLGSIGYITAKSDSETNTRYAPIYNYRLEQIPQVFQDSPFKVGALSAGVSYGSALEEIVLVIERGHWTDSAPWSGTTIQVSSQSTFNSATYGQEATSANKAFAANKGIKANISHIYRYDSSLTSYSSNLAAETAYELFPSPAGLNDAVYFGCQTSITDSGPFSNLVFDINTLMAGNYNTTWEYYNGSTWTNVNPVDNTAVSSDAFQVGGVNIVSWLQPSGWAANDPGMGVTGYWIRCRISSFTSVTAIPTQQNRRVYSQAVPYVEIATGQKGGTLPPGAIVTIYGEVTGTIGGIVGGFRSTDRGEDFGAFLNISPEQNPTGVTFNDGTVLTAVADVDGPTAYRGNYALGATENTPYVIGTFTVSSTVSNQYTGKYRAFMRGWCLVADQFWLEIVDNYGGGVIFSTSGAGSFPSAVSGTFSLLDLGLITIPRISDTFIINIYTERTVTTTDDPLGAIYDIVLIPADEYVFTAYSPTLGPGLLNTSTYLNIDGSRETEQFAATYNRSTDAETLRWVLLANTGPVMNTKTQRLWLMAYSFTSVVIHEHPFGVQIARSRRYLSLRGSS